MVELGYFCDDRYRLIGTTSAWNWQQGAMLQWVGISYLMAFNDYDGHKHIARIVDTDGKSVSVIPLPIAALSLDGSKALSYSFERLRTCKPAYSYANCVDPNADVYCPANDGLYFIDLSSGNIQRLFSLADIAHYLPEPSMSGAYHYFNHCSFNPSGQRLVFLHRWQKHGKERTRMLTCNCNGSDIHVFATSEMVSHFTWKDDQQLLVFARIAGIGDRYFLFQDRSPFLDIIGENCLTSDGHPTFSSDGRWILTDTYPDRLGVSKLVLYDTASGQRCDIARLRSPFQYVGDMRCDLHPRWNRDSTMISFDSAHTGVRALCTVKLRTSEGHHRCTVTRHVC